MRLGAFAAIALVVGGIAGCGGSVGGGSSTASSATKCATPGATSISTQTATASYSGRSGRGHFTVDVPSGWIVTSAPVSAPPGSGAKTVFSAANREPSPYADINITAEPSHRQRDIEAISRAELRSVLAGFPGARLSKLGPTTVGGEPARCADSTVRESSRTFRGRTIIVARDGWTEVITLTTLPDSFESSLPALGGLLRSWRWTNSASSSATTTTVGQLFPPTTDCIGPYTYLVTGVASGTSYTVPEDGVITSWSFEDGGKTLAGLELKVGRSAAGGKYTIVAQATAGTQITNHVNTYKARILVKAGDLIGISDSANGGDCSTYTGGSLDSAVAVNTDQKPGTTTTSGVPETGYRYPVLAQVADQKP